MSASVRFTVAHLSRGPYRWSAAEERWDMWNGSGWEPSKTLAEFCFDEGRIVLAACPWAHSVEEDDEPTQTQLERLCDTSAESASERGDRQAAIQRDLK